MKKLLTAATLSVLLSLGMQAAAADSIPHGNGDKKGNLMTMAVAYKETAAEYRALYYQGFNVAKMHVDAALAAQQPGDKPLCIVTDVDDTIVLHPDYWATLIANGHDAFNDPIWDKHVANDQLTAAPGAVDFLNYCQSKGVEVFYVTSRDQGEGTYDIALKNLKDLGFPYADTEHLTVLIDTSNKEVPQKKIAEDHNIVVFLGDSLNDFQRRYYVKDVAERNALMDEDKDLFGTKFIIMPNPTDGHWIRAIFGESEPAATKANREKWKAAASGK